MPKKHKKKTKSIKPKKPKEKYTWLKITSSRFFGNTVDKYDKYFNSLKNYILTADIGVLYRTYISLLLFFTLIVFLITIIVVPIVALIMGLDITILILGSIMMSFFTAGFTFFMLYIYPISRTNRRKKNINLNLPFAITHMAAIASSGVPPYSMFKILKNFKEYGEISNESGKIVRNIDLFGLDETRAIKEVIQRTPSRPFKEFLQGILSTIKTGGNLELFLKQQSEKALFNYRLRREKYLRTLETYADFYTALLIAAPLIFVTILLIINIMGAQVFGIPASEMINLGIFIVIPVLNIIFLLFVHATQPKM
jgi:flagellar protein FlaJ